MNQNQPSTPIRTWRRRFAILTDSFAKRFPFNLTTYLTAFRRSSRWSGGPAAVVMSHKTDGCRTKAFTKPTL